MIEFESVSDISLSFAVAFGTLVTTGWIYFKFHTKLLTWDELVPDWESAIVIGALGKSKNSRHIPGPHIILEVRNSAETLRRAIEEATGSNQTVEDGQGNAKEVELKAEIRIPKASVGLFIGKSGSNIKQIKKDSDAAIYLNDHVFDNGDRICVIRGEEDQVSQAKTLVDKFLECLPADALSKEIMVPKICVGRIIGHDGNMIKRIEEKSQATVFVDLTRTECVLDDVREYRFVVLRGTQEKIEMAEQLVEEQVEEFMRLRKIKSNATNALKRNPVAPPASLISTASPCESIHSGSNNVDCLKELNLMLNGKLEVFVSCVCNPNLFWIQIIGKESLELRKLSEAMTSYYHNKGRMSQSASFRPGDIVAAPFHWDGKMYRARVLRVNYDKTMEIEYVDYGDRRSVKSYVVRPLSMEFMKPKFQAIQASLNLLCPEPSWPQDVIMHFCDISHCAKWKSLTAKIKGFVTDVENRKIARIHLELMDKEKNVGEELIGRAMSRKFNPLNKGNQRYHPF